MNDVEGALSRLLHEGTPEPVLDVSFDAVAAGLRRRRRRLGTAAVVLAVVAVVGGAAVPARLLADRRHTEPVAGDLATCGSVPVSLPVFAAAGYHSLTTQLRMPALAVSGAVLDGAVEVTNPGHVAVPIGYGHDRVVLITQGDKVVGRDASGHTLAGQVVNVRPKIPTTIPISVRLAGCPDEHASGARDATRRPLPPGDYTLVAVLPNAGRPAGEPDATLVSEPVPMRVIASAAAPAGLSDAATIAAGCPTADHYGLELRQPASGSVSVAPAARALERANAVLPADGRGSTVVALVDVVDRGTDQVVSRPAWAVERTVRDVPANPDDQPGVLSTLALLDAASLQPTATYTCYQGPTSGGIPPLAPGETYVPGVGADWLPVSAAQPPPVSAEEARRTAMQRFADPSQPATVTLADYADWLNRDATATGPLLHGRPTRLTWIVAATNQPVVYHGPGRNYPADQRATMYALVDATTGQGLSLFQAAAYVGGPSVR